MISLRNILSLFVLCTALAITLGQVHHSSEYTNQNGAHYNQIRIRRQVADEQDNQGLENDGAEGEIDDDVAINIQEENVDEVADEEVVDEEVVDEEVVDEEVGPDATNVEDENVVENTVEDTTSDVVQDNNEEESSDQENQEQEDNTTNDDEENVTEDLGEKTTPAVLYPPFWTTCDFTIRPIKSCYDCNNLLICKRVGGLVKPCGNPFRPYCNNGICSPVPSAECA